MEKKRNYDLNKSNKSMDGSHFIQNLKDSFTKLNPGEQLHIFETYSALKQFSCFVLIRSEDKLKAFEKLKGFKTNLFKWLPDENKKEAFRSLSSKQHSLCFKCLSDYKNILEIYNMLEYEDRVQLFSYLKGDDMLKAYQEFEYEDRVQLFSYLKGDDMLKAYQEFEYKDRVLLFGYLKTKAAIRVALEDFKKLPENEKSSSYKSFMNSNIELAMYAFKYLTNKEMVNIFKLVNNLDLKEYICYDLPSKCINLEDFKTFDEEIRWKFFRWVSDNEKLEAFKILNIGKYLECQNHSTEFTDIFTAIPDKNKLSAFKYLIDIFVPYSYSFSRRSCICNLFYLSFAERVKKINKLYTICFGLPNNKQSHVLVFVDPSEIANRINDLCVIYSDLPICDRLEAFRYLTFAFGKKTEKDFKDQMEYYLYSTFWSELFVDCFAFIRNITVFKYLDSKFYFICFPYLLDSDKLKAFSFIKKDIPKKDQEKFFWHLRSLESSDILKFLEMLTEDHSDHSLDLGHKFLKEMSVNNKNSYLELIKNTTFCFKYFRCLPYDDRLNCFRELGDKQRVECYSYLSDQDKKTAFNLISDEKKRDVFHLYALIYKAGALEFFKNMSEEDKLHIIEKVKDMALNISDETKSQKLLKLVESLNTIKERKRKRKIDLNGMLDIFEKKSKEAQHCIYNLAKEKHRKEPSEKTSKVIKLLYKHMKEKPLQDNEFLKSQDVSFKED